MPAKYTLTRLLCGFWSQSPYSIENTFIGLSLTDSIYLFKEHDKLDSDRWIKQLSASAIFLWKYSILYTSKTMIDRPVRWRRPSASSSIDRAAAEDDYKDDVDAV